MKNSENPVFSIITVVYNSATLLEGTVKSVIQQSYQHIEYIIVDGNSSDGTLDVIRNYEDHIDQWISEPDQGIYDAMNKGIQMATGDFLWFMNAGDHLFDKDTLKQMAQKCEPDTTILYGEVMLVNDDREHMGHRSAVTTQQLPEELDWKSLKMGMVVSHQAFVPARRIAPPYIDGNLSADIDWVIKCLKKSSKNTHCHLVLAEYLMGGISVQKHKESLKDRYQVLRNHYGLVSNFINHVFIVFRAAGKRIKRRNKVRY